MSAITIILIVITIALTLGGIGLAFISWRWAAILNYAALWVLYYTPGFALPDSLMVFWGIATLIALGINYMLPFNVATSRLGIGYIAGGAVCGTAVGLILGSQAGAICGAALGCLCGAVAYSRTPRGRTLEFPSSRFFNYMLAKGLPLTVVMSVSGIVFMALYQFYLTAPAA